MIISKKKANGKVKPVIDLTGPEGNAFYLIGVVNETFKQSGAPELGKHVVDEMTKGDYEHLIKTFELYLGDHFILLR